MAKYKIGDVVKVRENITYEDTRGRTKYYCMYKDNHISDSFILEMYVFRGRKAVIYSFSDTKKYLLQFDGVEDYHKFTDEMLEDYLDPNEVL